MPKRIAGSKFKSIMDKMSKKLRDANVEHKRNGGICQKCRKEKAEYPQGLNPYRCAKCNAKTQQLINKLRKSSGFIQFKILDSNKPKRKYEQ